ncbi:cysteine-rich CWC family protein [Oceanobacter mangrovi]|uniref:cysteine-rich CWC family protein n=1 Tax=Oceanobacter mangrovi TaxID=2862510 RepID=UPI001C8E5B99
MSKPLFYELKDSANNMAAAETRCPVCQKTNECAVANQREASECWCMSRGFPPELKQQLELIDPERCLCDACLMFFKQHGHLPELSVNK